MVEARQGGAELDFVDAEALAADGAIACFLSSFLLRGLNADRAPQLKHGVRRLSLSES